MHTFQIEQKLDALENYALQERHVYSANDVNFDEFSLRPLRIDYDIFSGAIRKIASLHRRSRFNKYGGGLLITGASGTGKTSVLEYYRDEFPKYDGETGQFIPVLFVETPSAPAVKSLAVAILMAMGDPTCCKGTSEEKTKRIYKFFKDCKVELLLIDEFQHFAEVNRRGATRDVTDWLKTLINATRVGVVLSGLPACEETIAYNVQLTRRFSARHELLTFSYLSNERQLEFRGVLQSLQSAIPIDSICLYSDAFARRMFVASFGLIDFVVKILEEACDIARLTGATQLTLPIFSKAFRASTWALCPIELDPFTEAFVGKRALDQPGEPFHRFDESQVNVDMKRG